MRFDVHDLEVAVMKYFGTELRLGSRDSRHVTSKLAMMKYFGNELRAMVT